MTLWLLIYSAIEVSDDIMITKNFHVNYETMQKVDSVFYFMMNSNMNKLI